MLRKNKEFIKFLIAILLVAIATVVVPENGLSKSAIILLGIFAATVFLWISVGISWPSLFCILALSFLPELSMNSLVMTSVGNPAISFLIFTFCCSYALNRTMFTRRCAIWFLSTSFAKKGIWSFLILYFCSILILGSCMSTTVIVVLYLSINEELFAIMGLKKGDKIASFITIGLVITASISGAMTPIAHAFPMIAIGSYNALTGNSIDYISYMAAGVPAAVLAVAAMLLIFRLVMRPDFSAVQTIDTEFLKKH